MHGDVVRLFAFDFILRIVRRRVDPIPLELCLLPNDLHDLSRDAPRLRVPTYAIAHAKSALLHGYTLPYAKHSPTVSKEPADFRKALAGKPAAKAQWDELTPIARRDFISWIESAKQAETRIKRIGRACSMLADGKRRPCCYAIVPLDLHNALKAAPKAKARWSDLTPDARRNYIGWIESAKSKDSRRGRIDETCAKLAAGKRHS